MVICDIAGIDAAYAKEGPMSKTEGPVVVKSDGKTLAVVKDRETAKLVETGLRMKYCNGVENQQTASIENFITIERRRLRLTKPRKS